MQFWSSVVTRVSSTQCVWGVLCTESDHLPEEWMTIIRYCYKILNTYVASMTESRSYWKPQTLY